MSEDIWRDVCDAGTDPRLVEAVVARLASDRGASRRLARGAATSSLAEGLSGRALLQAVAGSPSRTARQAVRTVAETWFELGVRVALPSDPGYPARLMRWWPTAGAPPLLARRGAPVPDRPCVAIVGARRASPYGTGIAAWLAETAGAAGVHVVSGGAVGVDAAAHAAALEEPGATTAVLGCGHGVAYPRPHATPGGLFSRIVASGGTLLSEQLPHARPHRGNILARNRIVAGLADAVVVVEGGASSGSLRTAENAADLGVPVLAVPGDVRAPGSAAPHRLLAEGAAPCCGPDDLLAVLGADPGAIASDGQGGDQAVSVLPSGLRAVLAARWPRATRVDELAELTGSAIAAVLASVTRARVAGEVAEGPEGVRLRSRP